MHESDIQKEMAKHLIKKKIGIIVPNVFLYGGFESDLISVSKTGLVSEYEIKPKKLLLFFPFQIISST